MTSMTEMELHRTRGATFMNRQLYSAAQEEWAKWLYLSEQVGAFIDAASAANALGCCFSEGGRYNEALDSFSTASRHLRSSGSTDDLLALKISSNKSYALWAKGEADMAHDELIVADSIWGQGDGVVRARILLLRGAFALERELYREALALHADSIALCEELELKHMADMARLNRAIALMHIGSLVEGEALLGKCVQKFEQEHADQKHAAYALTELAYARLLLNSPHDALECCVQSIEKLLSDTATVDRLEIANVCRTLGMIFHVLGDSQRASLYTHRARGIFMAHRNPYVRKRAERDDLELLRSLGWSGEQTKDKSLYQWESTLNYCDSALSMIDAIEKMDQYTLGHSTRVLAYCRQMARNLHLTEESTHNLIYAARFHDIGKIAVPQNILTKEGPLSEDEWVAIRRHPELGADMIRMAVQNMEIAQIVQNHHERYDGDGYPLGICGEDIPLEAQILSVADAYDAMTSDRSYRKAAPHSSALRILQQESGRQFHPDVVEAFSKLHEL